MLGKDIHLSRNKLHELNKVLYFFGISKTYTNKKYRVDKQILTKPDWINRINELDIKDSRGERKIFKSVDDFLNYLCGYRSFLISIIHGNINKNEHTVQLQKKVKKIEEIIQAILNHVGSV